MAINRDKVLREAEKLVQKGRIEQAIREYEKLLKANPNDANTINRVGDLYGRVGQVDKAVELYERIADYFTQDGFTSKAIAILKKINRMAPQRLDIFDRLADLYLQQGLLVEARSQFQILSDWYGKNGDVENVIRVQRKLVQLATDDHVAHLRLADALMQAEQHEEAITEYERLGLLLLERGKLDEADRLYRHVLSLEPPRGEFLEPFCRALLDGGRVSDASKMIQAGLRLSANHHGLRALNARLLLEQGDKKAAIESAEELLGEQPEDNELRAVVAGAALENGDVGQARDLLLPVAEAAIRGGEFRKAQELLQGLLKADPEDAQVLTWALRAYEPTDNEEMVFALKAALAERHFREDRPAQALRLYLELAETDPDNKLFRERLNSLSAASEAGGDRAVEPPVGLKTPTRLVPDTEAIDLTEVADEGEDRQLAIRAEVQAGAAASDPAVPATFDPQERLAEANVFTKYGLVDKAVRHLEEIIEHYPGLLEAREKLVLLYVEEGRREEARQVANPLIEHYSSVDDRQALEALERALNPAPTEGEPVAEVEELGESDVLYIDIDDGLAAGGARTGAGEAVTLEAAEDAGKAGEESGIELPAEGERELIGEVAATTPPAVGVQSFVLEELEELERSLGTAARRGMREGAEPAAPAATLEPTEGAESVAPEAKPEPVRTAVPEEMVDITGAFTGPPVDDLEQVDFYIAQELFEDALRVLTDLELQFPDDPEVRERRLRLKEKGVILEQPESVGAERPEELFAEEEDYIDLARELEQELAAEEAMVEEATGRGKGEALLEEVFREFQRGVAEQLSEEDSDTHFNLGIAYKEMGLLPEAIGEFQISARDAGFFVESCSMIGVCYLEQGLFEQAAQWYRKALSTPDLSPETKLALLYDLGSSLEAGGDESEAVSVFTEVAGIDPSFRDVVDRLQGLRQQRQAN
jgi:tetratricopeptide (TPR) repeat protein